MAIHAIFGFNARQRTHKRVHIHMRDPSARASTRFKARVHADTAHMNQRTGFSVSEYAFQGIAFKVKFDA